MKEKKKKVKVVYYEDKGETVYPMAATYGLTPEELEKQKEAEKNATYATGKERFAMIKAAFSVYGPLLLIVAGAFSVAALLMYFFLK